LPRQTRWIIGLDLGTAVDFTALSVIESVKGKLDWNTLEDRHSGCGIIPQKDAHRLYVKHLERYPLGLSYPQIIDRVLELLSRPPLGGDDLAKPADLVIDDTGAGRPVSDLLVDRGLRPIRVTITAGLKAEPKHGDRWHVPKELLISGLDAELHEGSLVIAAALAESHALKNELIDFRRTVSQAGRATYTARGGQHDDLVLSVACAVWWAKRPPAPAASFGTYGL
jgi:hypothetical protein